MKWVMDFCAQSLRNIVIGRGGKMDGFEMESGFQITVSSEMMAILAVATDLADLRQRIGQDRRRLRQAGQPGHHRRPRGRRRHDRLDGRRARTRP